MKLKKTTGRYAIVCGNPEQIFILASMVKSWGFSYCCLRGNLWEDAIYSSREYPVFVLSLEHKTASGMSLDRRDNPSYFYQGDNAKIISFEGVVEGFFEREDDVQVKLNDKYTAVVSKDSITVGCTTFPISVLDDLNKARESFSA